MRFLAVLLTISLGRLLAALLARLLRRSLGHPGVRPRRGGHAGPSVPAAAPEARQSGHTDASICLVAAMRQYRGEAHGRLRQLGQFGC